MISIIKAAFSEGQRIDVQIFLFTTRRDVQPIVHTVAWLKEGQAPMA